MPLLPAPSAQALQALRAIAFASSLMSASSRGAAAPWLSCGHELHHQRRRAPGPILRTMSTRSPLHSPRPAARRPSNPNAPKTHDRGPPSSESTQTDFSKLDIFQSFNVPIPATSIDACTEDGFHLNNDVKITDHDALSLLAVLHPKPDLLLVGTGARLWMLSRATRDYLNADLGIRVDVMDTANASSAYNLLAQERGVEQGSGVGAALLPLSWSGQAG
ncbi:hypothetical protein DV735_g5768, partial [Chaetothyriales sp. CBS 134920]